MKRTMLWSLLIVAGLLFGGRSAFAQDNNTTAKNALSWKVSGRVQLQHVWNEAFSLIDEAKTKHGYRLRRGRFQVDANIQLINKTAYCQECCRSFCSFLGKADNWHVRR